MHSAACTICKEILIAPPGPPLPKATPEQLQILAARLAFDVMLQHIASRHPDVLAQMVPHFSQFQAWLMSHLFTVTGAAAADFLAVRSKIGQGLAELLANPAPVNFASAPAAGQPAAGAIIQP